MEVSGVFTGTCLSMCSDSEMTMREREGLLHPLEAAQTERNEWASSLVKGKSPCKSPEKLLLRAHPHRVVKEFSRSAAGRTDMDPSDVRPAAVLRQTMSYLLNHIAVLETLAWAEIYDFVFDRIRAVRQDVVVQGIMGRDAIAILEQAVRFHAYASYRLRHCKISEFDPVINKQHLLECLKRLLYLYQITEGPHDNQVEFESVYLLDNVGHEAALSHCLSLDVRIRHHPLVLKSFLASTAVMTRNYARALRLIHSVRSPMCLCVVSSHLTKLRTNYIQILSHGFSAKNCQFPVQKLSTLLHAPSVDFVSALCSSCHLTDWFSTPQSSDFVCFSKSNFSWPNEVQPCPSISVLDEMLRPPFLSNVLIYGWTERVEEKGGGEYKHNLKTRVDNEIGKRERGFESPQGRGRGSEGFETPRGRGRGRGKRVGLKEGMEVFRKEECGVNNNCLNEGVEKEGDVRRNEILNERCRGLKERFEDVAVDRKREQQTNKENDRVRLMLAPDVRGSLDDVEERLRNVNLNFDREKEEERGTEEKAKGVEVSLQNKNGGENGGKRRRGKGRGRMKELEK